MEKVTPSPPGEDDDDVDAMASSSSVVELGEGHMHAQYILPTTISRPKGTMRHAWLHYGKRTTKKKRRVMMLHDAPVRLAAPQLHNKEGQTFIIQDYYLFDLVDLNVWSKQSSRNNK